jgi:hypothetical protein
MGQILSFPTASTTEQAWRDYQRLAQRSRRNPLLLMDRTYMDALADAHQRFSTAFREWVNS